jgi:hypothetical protein
VLSYGLRLNAALFPFLLPVLVVAVIVSLLTDDPVDAAWLAACAVLEVIGYGLTRFWLSTIEDQSIREWQQRHREDDDLP